jgi:uncharacterized protein (TIRG00374 family)
VLIAAGMAAVAWLVAATGLDALLAPIRAWSWRIVVLVLLPHAAVAILRTLAWRLVFVHAHLPLGRLFAVRLAGDALNEAAASVGGEPVKAWLLRPGVPLVEGSAAVVVDKTAITASQVLFLALGLAAAPLALDLPAGVVWGMAALLALQVVAVGLLVLVQCVGVIGRAARRLERLGLSRAASRVRALAALDGILAASYGARRGRVLACVLVHLAGWLTGALEIYLALRWLDTGASFLDALVIDAFATGVKFLGFAIPGALGVLEGGVMLAFGALGFGGGLGLSFALVRRLRVVVWSVLGVAALTLLRAPAAGAAAPHGD